LQLFTHPQHSEWFSTLSAIIFEVNIVAEQKQHIGEEYFVFYEFEFQSNTFTDRCPTAASAATCILCNSTCKLIISIDIIEVQITKLLAKLLTESHWR